MARDYELNWSAHPNIYNNNSGRELKVYFSEPESGVNEDTGLILFIPGFGGNAHSNVYKKMRSNFADEYNLVTVQCDYFGQEFMQGSNKISINLSKESVQGIFSNEEISQIFNNGFDFRKFLDVASQYNLNVTVNEVLEESLENFNDMGIMQAIDNITALTYVIQILKDNDLIFNSKKIILFGQSQGAYLSYLCNALAPDLFTLLIDNSSWLFPQYLKSPRYLYSQIGKMNMQTEFSYLASKMHYDEELLHLPTLYKQVDNKCMIKCFHGTTDNLINHEQKREFCKQINHCDFNEVTSEKVDGVIFKSTNHGLDADFIKLVDYVYNDFNFEKGTELNISSVSIKTKYANYKIEYSSGVPILKIENKK